MKRVINGKVYNTETATFICAKESPEHRRDFSYWREDLYKSPKGMFFIHYDGEALSKYRKPCGNNGSMGDEGIRLLTPGQALQFCEEAEADLEQITAAGFEIAEG